MLMAYVYLNKRVLQIKVARETAVIYDYNMLKDIGYLTHGKKSRHK